MKKSMKKLAVLVIIVAIAMFFVWAMASAGDLKGKKSIRGQYTGTGGGTCIIAIRGFNANLTPNCTDIPTGTPCAIVQWYSREGDYKFKFEHDGTGSVTSTGRVVAQYFSPSGALGLPYAGSTEVEYDFTYTVDDSGMVTITQVPETYFSKWTFGPAAGRIFKVENYESTGSITPDGKGMNQASGAPAKVTLQEFCLVDPGPPPEFVPCPGAPLMSMICNFDTVLIWQND